MKQHPETKHLIQTDICYPVLQSEGGGGSLDPSEVYAPPLSRSSAFWSHLPLPRLSQLS